MRLPESMQALQLREPGRLEQLELSVPRPGPEQVLIKTTATTICTSDLLDISHNPFGIALPRVLGHEGAGIVAEVGEAVQGFCPGQRVTAHPVIPCLHCENCLRNLRHLCLNMGHLGIDRDGTFAEYFCIRADRVRLIPEGLDTAVAALTEPVAVCIEAVERAHIGKSDTVLIVGDGPFGIIIARLVLGREPEKVIVVGHHDFRLKQVGEAVCVNQKQVDNIADVILTETSGSGADAAILCANSQAALNLCISSLRARGRLSVFSALRGSTMVDMFRVHIKELEIFGSCNDREYLDAALAHLANDKLCLSALVTHRIPFSQWQRGIELASRGKDEALKVALIFGDDK